MIDSKQFKKSNNLLIIRLLGVSGIIGGIFLLFGDLLFFWGHVSNISSLKTIATGYVPIETMAFSSDWRLITTSILAMISAWFYTIGSGLVFYAIKPAGKKIAFICFITFAMTMIGAGILHTVFFAIGIGAKNAFTFGGGANDAIEATRIAIKVFNLNFIILYIPGIIYTLLAFYAILKRKTHLPKWVILVFPVFLINSQYLVIPFIPKNMIKQILIGGYANASMLLFYTILTIVMWNGGKKISEFD